MKRNKIHFSKLSVFVLALMFGLFTNLSAAGDKMKPEEVVAKHLESIGTAEARAAMKSATIIGDSKVTFFGTGGGFAEGISVLASEGDKYLVAMKFNNPAYPFEKIGFDGDEFSVGYIKPGKRSALGDFLRTNQTTFKRGLLSGVLSSSWELLNFDGKDAKLKYAGLKKIDDKQLHKLEYNPKKGSDLNISLYFDADTFRHVRTEYTRVISANQGATIDTSAEQSEVRYKLVEEFSDFSEENKLTMPHTYRIYMEILGRTGTTSYEWMMNFKKFNFNEPIDVKEFRVDSY